MSSTKSNKAAKSVPGKIGDLSQNDLHLAVIAWNCLIDNKIDLDKFVSATQYANATSARVCWNAVRRKLEKYYTSIDNTEDSHETLNTPTNPGKRSGKRKAVDLDASGDCGSKDNTPDSKKKKATSRKPKGEIKAKDEDVETAMEPTENGLMDDEYSAEQQLIDEDSKAYGSKTASRDASDDTDEI